MTWAKAKVGVEDEMTVTTKADDVEEVNREGYCREGSEDERW